jgi:hypothetical protein
MSQSWWYAKDNQKLGPYPIDKIESMYAEEIISDKTLIWQEGMSDWLPLAEVESLKNTLKPLPPPIPTQTVMPPPLSTLDNETPTSIGVDRVLEQESQSPEYINLSGKWRRFFARNFDIWLSYFIVLIPAALLVLWFPSYFEWIAMAGAWESLAIGVFLFGLAFLLDATIYALFGNTLGKRLLNIKVLHVNGEKLSFKSYLVRNNLVWLKGYALGIPLLNLAAMLVQYNRIAEGKKASYDVNNDYIVTAKPISWFLLSLFIIGLIVLSIAISFINQNDKHLHSEKKPANSQTKIEPSPKQEVFRPDLEKGIAAYDAKDYETALKHFIPLADQGVKKANILLGDMYFIGLGVSKNTMIAFNYYYNSENPDLLFMMAKSYYSGSYYSGSYYSGYVHDAEKAEFLFEKASLYGSVEAQLFLADMYFYGDGVSKNINKAIVFYTKAAEKGNSSAQLALSNIFFNGLGNTPKNKPLAYHWANLAVRSSSGDYYYTKAKDKIKLSMTIDEIKKSEAFTREYLANINNSKDILSEKAKPKNESQSITGTAFLINKIGHLLTNAHVVNQCQTIKVYSENTTHIASLVARDVNNDMAIIKVQPWSDAKPVSFSKKSVALGQDIYAIGYPLPNVLALDLQMTKGNVSALAGLGNDSRFYQISAPVQSGNSGGPLVNGYGLVSGMVTSKANIVKMKELTGDFPQNVNFALKESQLKNYLETNNIAYETLLSDDELKGEHIATQARKYTVLVECVK